MFGIMSSSLRETKDLDRRFGVELGSSYLARGNDTLGAACFTVCYPDKHVLVLKLSTKCKED